ncbi:MAG: transglycosylase domain-containing protein, partial [Chlorobiales bacterium]|nr:transglycosylase domain-containing protein [Chlorobiales bacterium]
MQSSLLEKLKAIYTSNAFLKSSIFVLSVFTSLILSFVSYRIYIELEYKDVILNLKNYNPKTTALIEERKKASGLKESPQLQWLGISEIPYVMTEAVVIGEDALFFNHRGFNFKEMWKALKDNISDGSLGKGGSTISQQLAKNLFLSTDKTLGRKLDEMFITISLEKHLSKERILELYLNVAQFGPSIFGVKNAAKIFFNKEVCDLNTEEILRLITVLPKPSSVKPT